MRCVLLHTQRCHESKACTSPATALSFSQNKQPQRRRASSARAYSKRAQAVKGVKRGRAVIHILPLPFFARLCNIAGRRLSAQHSHPPPTLSHRKTINNQRTQTVKGRRGEGSSTQLNTFTLCSPHFRPPVHYRRQVRGPNRLGLVYRHVVVVVVRHAPENISAYV